MTGATKYLPIFCCTLLWNYCKVLNIISNENYLIICKRQNITHPIRSCLHNFLKIQYFVKDIHSKKVITKRKGWYYFDYDGKTPMHNAGTIWKHWLTKSVRCVNSIVVQTKTLALAVTRYRCNSMTNWHVTCCSYSMEKTYITSYDMFLILKRTFCSV